MNVEPTTEIESSVERTAIAPFAQLFGYLPGVEIYKGYAEANPHNCAVKERTGDGVPVGPCCFYLENGTTCPRHGKVKADNDPDQRPPT